MADTKISAETAAGTLDGTEIVPVVKGGANRRTTSQAIADLAGGGGSGLYSQVLSATPTGASTGLSTWVNQGSATVADDATGVTIYSPSNGAADNLRLRHKAVPATPYTVTALVGFTANPTASFPVGSFGWYDGTTKLQSIDFSFRNAAAVAPRMVVRDWDTITSPSTLRATVPDSVLTPTWCRLQDDGTTVSFQISFDGVHFATLYSIAKASGFLGSSGYSRIFYGVNAFSAEAWLCLLSYAEG